MLPDISLSSSSKSSNNSTSESEVLNILANLGIHDYDPQVSKSIEYVGQWGGEKRKSGEGFSHTIAAVGSSCSCLNVRSSLSHCHVVVKLAGKV